MDIPADWTVEKVGELVGGDKILDVMEVSTQTTRQMLLADWVKYFNLPNSDRERILNVIRYNLILNNQSGNRWNSTRKTHKKTCNCQASRLDRYCLAIINKSQTIPTSTTILFNGRSRLIHWFSYRFWWHFCLLPYHQGWKNLLFYTVWLLDWFVGLQRKI